MASAGHDVVLGSRDASVRATVAQSPTRPRGTARRGNANDAAAACDHRGRATPWDSAIATVRPCVASSPGKIVISMVNALTREGREIVAALSAARFDGRADAPSRCRRAGWSAPSTTCRPRRWRTSTADSTRTC